MFCTFIYIIDTRYLSDSQTCC